MNTEQAITYYGIETYYNALNWLVLMQKKLNVKMLNYVQ